MKKYTLFCHGCLGENREHEVTKEELETLRCSICKAMFWKSERGIEAFFIDAKNNIGMTQDGHREFVYRLNNERKLNPLFNKRLDDYTKKFTLLRKKLKL